ncbi:MAG: ADP-ribosylglycohydrolase family protein [Methanobacteriaceae archaeon]|nr:ADP-ribosylglycohydrolase family protein [Methanobacteriaceae archaeon]
MININDRIHGCLLGLAIGDAMGAPVEFKPPGTFEPVTGYRSSPVHKLNPGEWTDDTSLALCLLDSLIQCKGFDPKDQMQRYLRWYREGYLSIRGECFDIGNTTREALQCFERTGNPYCGPDHEYSAGNGSLMRIASIPLYFRYSFDETVKYAALSSRTTHQHPLAVESCQVMACLIHGALNGVEKKYLLSPEYLSKMEFHKEIQEVLDGSYKRMNPPYIRGMGYVVKSLEASLWAFYNSNNFKEGCLLAVNLGEDSDTTGAIYGGLAGAYYGRNNIPNDWIDGLAEEELIETFISDLICSIPE